MPFNLNSNEIKVHANCYEPCSIADEDLFAEAPTYLSTDMDRKYLHDKDITKFKRTRSSDFETGSYVPSVNKVRKILEFPEASDKLMKLREKALMYPKETSFIVTSLQKGSVTSLLLFNALEYYSAAKINSILLFDFEYANGVQVTKNKENLLFVCDSYLSGL